MLFTGEYGTSRKSTKMRRKFWRVLEPRTL
jgi:hypothetical protein